MEFALNFIYILFPRLNVWILLQIIFSSCCNTFSLAHNLLRLIGLNKYIFNNVMVLRSIGWLGSQRKVNLCPMTTIMNLAKSFPMVLTIPQRIGVHPFSYLAPVCQVSADYISLLYSFLLVSPTLEYSFGLLLLPRAAPFFLHIFYQYTTQCCYEWCMSYKSIHSILSIQPCSV